MRQRFTPLLVAIFMTTLACLMNSAMAQTHSPKTITKGKTTAKSSAAATIAAGKGLLSKSDCLSCHKLDVKLVGPAYKDVAAKYPATDANISLLSLKVIGGGSGVWGEVPMSPHPDLATADVKKMITYILSVK